MLLTIDAGNTNIVVTVFNRRADGDYSVSETGEGLADGIAFESRIDTNTSRMADQYAIMLMDILRLYQIDKAKITGAVISSVVPPVTRQLVTAVRRLTGEDAVVVEPGVKTGLNIRLDDPASSVGADLVCGAVAAKAFYPCPCIAIDLGTVTKILALDNEGTLIGGVLAPGVGISFEAMSGKTALLPLVGVGGLKKVIGSNTVDCIRSGIIFGTACMLDGFIDKFESEIGKSSVVATGGFAEIITPYCERDITVNMGLVSQGLRIIYEKNVK